MQETHTKHPVHRILGFAALIGFAGALIVHIAALTGIDVADKFPAVLGLHIGIFVVFIPFIFSSRKTLGPKPTLAQIRAAFPMWVVGLGICIFVYVLVNFALFALNTDGGNPSIVDGKFVLMNHGALVRELSAAEYSTFKANEVRGFSGHWLAFYFVPFAYFMFHRRPEHSSGGI